MSTETTDDDQFVPAVAPNHRWCRENVDSTLVLDYGDETYVVEVKRGEKE